ncbi:hypothetical protein ABPG77_002055 [Micractinium sp. CCAP 211/92]
MRGFALLLVAYTLLISGALGSAGQRCPCKKVACKHPKAHCTSCYAKGSTRIQPGDIGGMCASCEAGYELSDDNRCICTRKPCKGRCPAGQVWAGFVGRQWLEHNALSAPKLFGWTCQQASKLGCSAKDAQDYAGCTRCPKGHMLYDSNYGYPAPDARPALACLPCNAADPAEHEGWTSQCLGSSGTPLTCKRGDQVCKGCPPGTYIARAEHWPGSLGKALVCGNCTELSCSPGACGRHGCTACPASSPYKLDSGTYSDCVDWNPNS